MEILWGGIHRLQSLHTPQGGFEGGGLVDRGGGLVDEGGGLVDGGGGLVDKRVGEYRGGGAVMRHWKHYLFSS